VDWWAWPPIIAGSLAGFGVIFKFLLKLARVVSTAEVRLPVLDEIARQFAKNGGSTLKDQLDRIEKKLLDNGHDVRIAQSTADDAKSMIMEHLQRESRGQTAP
jgi:hypothetical protein